MDGPLVVGVDGSDSGLRAVDWAVDEAVRHGLPLRLVHAAHWERYEGARPRPRGERPAGTVLADQIAASCAERAQLRDPAVELATEVRPGDAVSILLDAGRDAFALVTGARGRGGFAGMPLGSVGLTVAARAVCPVVVVRGEERNRQGDYDRLVLGVGDATQGTSTARFAFREAEARGSPLTAVRAWRRTREHVGQAMTVAGSAGEDEEEERAAALLAVALREAAADHPEVKVEQELVEGPAHQALVNASAEADLLVVGALRRHGHFGRPLGRVAHALLHHSRCPVAIVPHPA
ncbi:universal stress protein [Streptomyces sp. NPDC058045]|uniref:universal stress protein n=1 Tax=Streptomyces sp. NPDC058045 TaxID=3346311 RepID=UPI0036EE17F7